MGFERELQKVVNEFCTLKGPTTDFLQKISGSKLKVEIVCQELLQEKEGSILLRIVRLYFSTPRQPILYCVSRLKKENLSHEEYQLIIEGKLPIGRVFVSGSANAGVEKKNIQVNSESNGAIAVSLGSRVQIITKKQYDYFLNNREIGTITEYFNDESLARLFEYKHHRKIIKRFKPNNTISDETIKIEYRKLPTILAELHSEFSSYRRKGSKSCIALKAENTVSTAIVVLYLLSEKISFYMCAYQTGHVLIPPFCDKIITVGFNTSKNDFTLAVKIEDNPDHHQEESIDSGSVFFSSSGTSGPSKYIAFSHHDLIANAKKCKLRFGFNNATSLLIPVPLSHMYGMGVGLLPALLCGANVCFIERNNVLKLFGKLSECKPHFTLITPTMVKMILMLDKRLPGNSIYITAGEIISKRAYVDFESKHGELINLYGCTELGAIATSPEGNESAFKKSEGYILPLEGVEVKLDLANQGEIFCRHTASFSHYVDKCGNKISREGEWHSTKDIGIDSFSGLFKVVGRVDNCINRSGFLISLEEVELELNGLFSEINRAVVLNVEDNESVIARIIAICELNDGCKLDAETVLKTCRKEMKRYHQPDELHFVNTIPRLSNGKPDRYLLRQTIKKW